MFSFVLLLFNVTPKFDTKLSMLHRKYLAFENKLSKEQEKLVYENFKMSLFSSVDKAPVGERFGSDDLDAMDGGQFERYIATLFTKMGYTTEVTKYSGDQGIDVIAKNDIVTIGIQAKRYSGSVGNKAVQEAVGGKALYNLDKVMVISNNEFTASAKALAQANNVELWDGTKLKEKICQYQRLSDLPSDLQNASKMNPLSQS